MGDRSYPERRQARPYRLKPALAPAATGCSSKSHRNASTTNRKHANTSLQQRRIGAPQLLKRPDSKLKTVISTHHTLFFNVLCNELGKARKYFVNKNSTSSGYVLREETGDTPFFHHVAALAELYQAAQEDRLFTHHFNMLRTILEKTASFHGHKSFAVCIKREDDDPDGILHARRINILSHGNYSLFEPQQMLDENKGYFRKILHDFLNRYPFNPELFPAAAEEVQA